MNYNYAPFVIYSTYLYNSHHAGIAIELARLYYCDNHNGKGKAQDYEAHLSTWRTFP